MNRRRFLAALAGLPLARSIDWTRPAPSFIVLKDLPSPISRTFIAVAAPLGSDLLGDGAAAKLLATVAEAMRRGGGGDVIYLEPYDGDLIRL